MMLKTLFKKILPWHNTICGSLLSHRNKPGCKSIWRQWFCFADALSRNYQKHRETDDTIKVCTILCLPTGTEKTLTSTLNPDGKKKSVIIKDQLSEQQNVPQEEWLCWDYSEFTAENKDNWQVTPYSQRLDVRKNIFYWSWFIKAKRYTRHTNLSTA